MEMGNAHGIAAQDLDGWEGLLGLRLNFDACEVGGLKCLTGGCRLEFLGYVVNLESAEIRDSLSATGDVGKLEFEVVQLLLNHYSKAEPVVRGDKLVRFADLRGGQAYEKAFLRRAVQPIAEGFGDEPDRLIKCAERLGGRALTFGDCSAEVFALPHPPLTIIAWRRSEFPAQANMLYDQTANNYLPTEDRAVLGELMKARLNQALNRNAGEKQ